MEDSDGANAQPDHLLVISYCSLSHVVLNIFMYCTPPNGIARMVKKLHTLKGDYWIKQWFSSIGSLFKMGPSLKGKNFVVAGRK